MGRRGKKGGPMGGKWNISHSLQMRLALGYSCLIAVLLVLMNTYPLIMGQNLMFRSQQTALANQLVLITNTLTTADELTPETVEQAIGQLEELEVRRVLVTDGAGRVLYDTGEPSALGKYALIGEVVSALRGNDAFSSEYQDGAFSSRAASPVMNRNQVVGAVCLYDQDSDQGALLEELQRNLRLISVVVCLAVLVLFGAFSTFLSRRVRTLLGGIRTVRAGEYTHRISMDGHDELAQLAEEFNQLTGRLQVTEEERRRFVSDASHELKTPLASIRLLTDSILQDASIDRDTAREFVADIGEAADRLIHISQELLELNRLDEGRDMAQEPVDWTEQVELTYTAEPGCTVLATPDELHQVIYNLTDNAVKYTGAGGAVQVALSRREENVILTVADNGTGIPEEDLPRIFERFYRVDKARSRAAGGTGLGLSIVRDAVRHHGGTITVQARQPAGVVFTVILPAWREEESGG